MRIVPIGLALIAVIAAGCGGARTHAPASTTYTDPVHGIAVTLPQGWQRAATSLTPHLTDPREELSVGTYPLRYRDSSCAHMPSSALEDIGPSDAFVTLQERGLDAGYSWPDFPARPAHFGPSLGGGSEAEACAPNTHFTDHFFNFTDGDRHFDVLVAFGPSASSATQHQAWQILDSLKIDANVRPDWQASP